MQFLGSECAQQEAHNGLLGLYLTFLAAENEREDPFFSLVTVLAVYIYVPIMWRRMPRAYSSVSFVVVVAAVLPRQENG